MRGNHLTNELEPLPADSDPTLSSCLLREGVSIGMGLMSWCLSENCVADCGVDDEDGCVTGKLVKDRGTDALEIVISLREVYTQTWYLVCKANVNIDRLPYEANTNTHSHSLHWDSFHHQSCHRQINLQWEMRHSHHPCHPVPNAMHHPIFLSPRKVPSTALMDPAFQNAMNPQYQTQLLLQFVAISLGKLHLQLKSIKISIVPTVIFRVGRPPGAATNPEKRARRLAIQSHKEMLERMENIAKMQRGCEYDKSLIKISDHDVPKVTDEEMARQRKILEELESRPLIVDKTRPLTTKPLPNRAKPFMAKVPLSQSTPPKQTSRFASPINAITSDSSVNTSHIVSDEIALNLSTQSVAENKHGSQLLLSLLTAVLGKVDEHSATQPNLPTSRKGKAKDTAKDPLADVLKELLPLIPNVTFQTSALSSNGATTSPASAMPTSVSPGGAHVDRWKGSQRALPLSTNSPLFKTADETFYHSQPGPKRPTNQHLDGNLAGSFREPPKVREDAHPVPGGGWARGRNLVPRTASSTNLKPSPPKGGSEYAASSTAKGAIASTAEGQPNKENTPPTRTGRGLKRALSNVAETKEKGGVTIKTNDKKRKQNPKSAEVESAEQMRTGLKAKDQTNTFGGSSLTTAASSPSRSTASARVAQSLPMMAMSEPGYLFPPPPIVATSTSPDLIIEPPRTPPRPETSLDDNLGDSLFTPRAPDPELEPRFRGDTHHSDNGPPVSPSSARRARGSHVSNHPRVATGLGGSPECSGTDPGTRPVRTGWDLPPSSPPPPTSPISPQADISFEQDNYMVLELTTQSQSEEVEMEKSGTDGRFGDQGATINSVGVSTAVAGVHPSLASQAPDVSSDFDSLVGTDFDLGWLSQNQEGAEGDELDVEELWSSLGPMIAQAQSDSSFAANSQTSSQVEADFSCFDQGYDQSHGVDTGDQNGVDAVKLADDLKALFGGCVV